MGSPAPNFPNSVWNGLSQNPYRTSRYDNEPPDYRDWDTIVSELIATQIVVSVLSVSSLNGLFTVIGTRSTGAVNVVAAPNTNIVGANSDVCVVLGGTSLFPHNIGDASLAVIPGGYGNTIKNNSIMGVLIGAHHLVDTATHATISGGSYHSIFNDYGSVGGGTQNVSAGLYSAIGGGRNNIIGTDVTTLSAQANSGSNTITTVLALVAGRKVHIDYGFNTETFTVLSINGTTSTLSGNLTATHASGTKVTSDASDVTDSVISGGVSNNVTKTQASICGGFNNKAKGTASFVGGGTNNAATQTSATVGGGDQNVANATYSTATGGQLNTASGSFSVVIGGGGNTSSGQYGISGGSACIASAIGSISLGTNNTANNSYATVSGGYQNTAAGLYSGVPSGRGGNAYKNYSRVLSGGFFSAAGDAQSVEIPQRRLTSNATATELRADGSGEQLAMPDNTAWRFTARIIGWRIDTHAPVADIKLEGVIYRQTGAATTALFGTVTKTANAANTATTDASATADTTLGGLSIKVTGLAGVTIYWSSKLELIEVAG